MFKNHFKIAWRNLIRNRFSSLINIGGLAVGMAVALLIGLWVYDELSFNKYHEHYDRIAKGMVKQTSNGKISTYAFASIPVGMKLKEKYGSDFKYVVLSSMPSEDILAAGENKFSKTGIYMDKDAAALFSLKMKKGDRNGLNDPHSILLAASTAKAIFGDADPMNKLIKINDQLDVKVTGVYEDPPQNSELTYLGFIAPWELYVNSQHWVTRSRDNALWDDNSFQLFVQLEDHADLDNINKKIAGLIQTHMAPGVNGVNYQVFLSPMRDWHLRAHWEEGRQAGGLIEYVWLFGTVGIFVLLLACINFMNLSTARSERRSKEVGIRKTIGSLRRQLIGQFYIESLLVVACALIGSLGLAQVILPWFDHIADKNITIPWAAPLFWLVLAGTGFLIGIIAGSYPALYLSSFQPIKVLKGTFRVGRFAAMPRKILVIFQFSISLALIIGTIIVYTQVQYSRNRPIGYDRDGLMMIRMKSHDFYGKYGILGAELKNTGSVKEMAESSSPLTDAWSNENGFSWEEKNPGMNGDFNTVYVTHEFGRTIGWKFKEGRDFSKDFPTDSSAIILNEAAVKFMGIKKPVGAIVRWDHNGMAKDYKVVGVIKDMLMESPYENVRQTIYFMDYENANWIVLKLDPNKSAAASVAKIETVFKKVIPSAPFDYKFADIEFASKFATEDRIGKLSFFFTVLAVLISCLGLFGLASYMTEQRVKEIGIRKVLGASVASLWGMLSRDFVILVGISCLIAIPLAWYYMSGWLQKYTYRTEITGWVFGLSACSLLLLTLFTVSFQAVRAALANPMKSLRSE